MPIELVHGFLAISADTSPDGRFSVLGGGFEAIEVPAYPTFIPALSVIARVRIPYADADREEADQPHEVEAAVYGPDGGLIHRSGPAVLARVERIGPRIGPIEHGAISNLVIHLFGIPMNTSGLYRIDFPERNEGFGSLGIPVVDATQVHGA
jgi:hypothetical protein